MFRLTCADGILSPSGHVKVVVRRLRGRRNIRRTWSRWRVDLSESRKSAVVKDKSEKSSPPNISITGDVCKLNKIKRQLYE